MPKDRGKKAKETPESLDEMIRQQPVFGGKSPLFAAKDVTISPSVDVDADNKYHDKYHDKYRGCCTCTIL